MYKYTASLGLKDVFKYYKMEAYSPDFVDEVKESCISCLQVRLFAYFLILGLSTQKWLIVRMLHVKLLYTTFPMKVSSIAYYNHSVQISLF